MRYFPLLILILLQTGCSSLGGHSAPKVESVRIELKGEPGARSETRYYSSANVKSYSDGQILRDKHETVDFNTLTSVKSFDPQQRLIEFTVRTIKKDGIVELHDLGFPEKNEEIDYRTRSTGEVLRAGPYTPTSLFFVPSMPVPRDEVRIGDTWAMEHAWLSAKEGIPLKLEIIGILKNIVSCDHGKTCADIELSGRVQLGTNGTAVGARFNSRIWGRMLFGVERGEVLWSELRSEEEMGVKGDRFTVLSCMTSETKIAARYQLKLECLPEAKAVTQVPQL